MNRYARGITLSLLTLLWGCASDPAATSSVPKACTPNATVECSCLDGSAGFQQCDAAGEGYVDACECQGGSGTGVDTVEPDIIDSDSRVDSGSPPDSDEPNDSQSDAVIDTGTSGDVSDTGTTADVSDSGTIGDVSDTGTSGDVSDGGPTSPPVTGGGPSFEEPYTPVSCVTSFRPRTFTAAGGRVYGSLSSTLDDMTAAQVITEEGVPLTGMSLAAGGHCALDTKQQVWCWTQHHLPKSQQDSQRYPLVAIPITEANGDAISVQSHSSSPNEQRHCVVRKDGTIGCWGSTGANNVDAPQFPPTSGCTDCAASPTTVLSQGALGAPLPAMRAVVVGDHIIAAIDEEGAAWFWGLQSEMNKLFGPLVQDTPGLPTPRADLPPVTDIVLGSGAICVLTQDQNVLCLDPSTWTWTAPEGPNGETLAPVKRIDRLLHRAAYVTREDGNVFRVLLVKIAPNPLLHVAPVTVDGLPIDNAVTLGALGPWTMGVLRADGVLAVHNPSQDNAVTSYATDNYPQAFDSLCLQCVPHCGLKSCGDDGCGGSCGTCPGADDTCMGGECIPADCQPSCDAPCGSDGCGGSCGSCAEGAPPCYEGSCNEPVCLVERTARTARTKLGQVLRMCEPHNSNCKPSQALLHDANDSPLDNIQGLSDSAKMVTCGHRGEELWCWTLNSSAPGYSLGLGGAQSQETGLSMIARPVEEESGETLSNVHSVSNGGYTTCAIRDSGELICWGNSYNGAFFAGDPACDLGGCSAHPRAVLNTADGDPITDARKVWIGPGGYTAALVRTDGSVWLWGPEPLGGYRHAGWTDVYQPQPHPVKVEGLPGPATRVEISGNNKLACVLLEDSSVWCWGHTAGVLGSGNPHWAVSPAPRPLRYGPLGDVILGVVDFTYSGDLNVLLDTGALWAWGGNALTWAWGGSALSNGLLPAPLLFQGQPLRHGWRLDGGTMTASARTVFTALGQVIHTVHKTGLFAESKEVTYYYDTLCAPATEAD